MFKEIFLFELKQCLKKPAIYIFFAVFLLFNLLIGLATTGAFDTTRSDSMMIVNSSYVISNILLGNNMSLFGFLGNVLLIFTMAVSIQKDYQYNTHALYFTKPINKFQYFFGRLFSTYLIALFVFTGTLIGYYLGTLHGIGTEYVGEFKISNYLAPYLIFTVPNTFLFGVILFSLTTYLRNTMIAYIVAIVFMVFQIATNTITSDIENKTLSAFLDPTGAKALSTITEYWSPFEKNENIILLKDKLLYNRLLWISISIVITLLSYWRFNFSQFLQPLHLFKNKNAYDTGVAPNINSLADIPKATISFSIQSSLYQTWYLSVFEFKKSIKSLFYIIMVILGIGLMLLTTKFLDSMYATPSYMVTYQVIEKVVSSIGLFSFIFILFYAGNLIWRDRESKTDELIGTTPVANKTLFASKAIGLLLAVLLLECIACATGICLQLLNGFTQINIWQYIVDILLTALTSIVTIAFCLCIQTLSPNKYLGFFICIAPLVILPIVFSLLEWDVFLLDFNSTGAGDPYSDMNGYGSTFIQYPIYRLYWYSFVFFFVCISVLLYARGKEKGLFARYKLSKYFFNTKYKLLLAGSLVSTIAFGAYIFYEKRIADDYVPAKESEKKTAEYEKKYKKYEHLKQPRITATSLHVDIYPSKKELHAAGIYTLKNKHNTAIDSIYVSYFDGKKSEFSYSKLSPSVPYKEVLADKERGIKIFKLNTPLAPNDSIQFEFDMWYKPRDYFYKAYSPIAANGTFINNNYFPSFGYNSNAELSENTARKEYGLPPKARMALITDSAAAMDNYISHDADWINFEATVSTDEGQIAIAPGYLQKEWKKDGRHFYYYKMDSPILNFYSFLSAAYQVKKETWQNVNLEIYYQKGHEYNLERMMKAMKKGLEYYTTNFGPYQHKQLRIIEFPRYQSFAQSFPNTIPYSEEIGFITKVDDKDPESIDVPFYVTAHEVAHQWWAHQVIGGDVQGSVLMSETMSQYSALMVMEKEYGKDAMKKFLKYEMDKYLQGRTFESKGERPLMLVENQQHIHYNKGSVIMYGLKDYIGEATLNSAIREYLNKVKFTGPPYTTAIEFVNCIKKVTPDSLQYLVSDAFENITIYENYIKKLDYKKVNDKEYKVTLTVGSVKFYADSTGSLKFGKMNDYFDIGIFSTTKQNNKEVEKPLLMTRVKLSNQEQTFVFTVNEKPISAGIDPYLKLIDRTPNNNTCKFGDTPDKPNLSLKNDDFSIMFKSKSKK